MAKKDPLGPLRAEFQALMENAQYGATKEEWQAAVAKLAFERYGDNPTPEQWLQAARDAVTKCDNCSGTGCYLWGASVNGRMTHSGPCFRCQSKGYQNQGDHHRNRAYDNHRRVV